MKSFIITLLTVATLFAIDEAVAGPLLDRFTGSSNNMVCGPEGCSIQSTTVKENSVTQRQSSVTENGVTRHSYHSYTYSARPMAQGGMLRRSARFACRAVVRVAERGRTLLQGFRSRFSCR